MRVRCENAEGPVWRVRLSGSDDEPITLSAEGLGDLLGILGLAEHTSRCRVLVIEARAGEFCRGMDLEGLVQNPEAHTRGGTEQYASCLRALRGSSKVVVSLVDGPAVAGGLGLALAADLVIATGRASFGLPELTLGLVPAMVLAVLLERVSPQKARRLALSGLSIEGAEAEAMGLVDRLVEGPDELEPALRRELKQLLRLEPKAVTRLKEMVSRMAPMEWPAAIGAGAECTTEMLAEPSVVKALKAYLDGEPLPWFERYRPGGEK